MMSFAYDPFLPSGMRWRDLFDMVIVMARKPDFFNYNMSLWVKQGVCSRGCAVRLSRGVCSRGRNIQCGLCNTPIDMVILTARLQRKQPACSSKHPNPRPHAL